MNNHEKSEFVKKLKGIKKAVFEKLMSNQTNRDNDEKLVWNIWNSELRVLGYDMKLMTAYELGQLAINGSLSSSASIRRARRKLNEELPETRGKSYEWKKKDGELTRKEIKDV